MGGWDKIFETLKDTYYAPLFYILWVVIALIAGLIFHRKSKIGKLFLAYLLFDLIIYIIDDYVHFFSDVSKAQEVFFVNATNVLICLVEISVYLFYFKLILFNKKIRLYITIFQILFPALIIILFLTIFIDSFKLISWVKIFDFVGLLELSILIVPSFTYYIELFSLPPKENLIARPSFWITTGIFLFAVLSIPYYSINYYLFENNYKYFSITLAAFFYLPLAFNYILLSRAFLCKKTLTI